MLNRIIQRLREHSIDVAEHKSVLKNYHNAFLRIIFTPKIGKISLKQMFVVIQV